MAAPDAQALLERWRTEKDFTVRDEILEQMIENRVFPGAMQEEYEHDGGLYPDLEDPMFLPKLMRKKEFQESKQKSIKDQMAEGIDKCRSTEDFELSSVQKFVNRLLSPRTPYRSALLFHGVGVGKTCAAVTVAESFLAEYPSKKIFIIAPPNIQEGFKRTIFDRDAVTIGVKGSGTPNHHRGCTDDIYLELTSSMTEQNKATIETKVAKAIKSRYEFFGYTSFYNHIVNLLASLPKKGASPEYLEEMKRRILRQEFSNRVIIVDEAHNLRDNPMEAEVDAADDTPGDSADSKAGKKLTPFLKEVLEVAEGTTLLLMTATPMYNSFVEIVFLMNLLLTNDKFAKLRVDEIFDVRGQKFVDEAGKRLLGKVVGQYVSFMRGENPLTFPIRIDPITPARVTAWPTTSPKGEPIAEEERTNCIRLPCIAGTFSEETAALYAAQSDAIVGSAEGLGITNMDTLVQAGNWVFPGEEGDDFLDRIRQQGFDNTFTKEKRGALVSFRNNNERGASWLLDSELPRASGKCAELLRRLNAGVGVAFVYSRFVPSGALTIALALEANGYTCWGRDFGFLAEGNQHPEGRQCALCPLKERAHQAAHPFKPAKYVLLTGSEELSPNNAKSIDAARAAANKDGGEVKVVIGSQIAGEGLDLRYIREIFVFDSWYHLNKLEQIVGRGIRTCSHASLPPEKRNCTVSLLVNTFGPAKETIDMYSYRQALKKAIVVGNVTRVLKEYAIDCSLNRDAVLVRNLDPLPRILDSQGAERLNVPINDVPLTPMCDWLQTCDYDCKYGDDMPMITDISLEDQDGSTYDEYTARSKAAKLRLYLQDRIARGTPFVTFEKIESDFSTIPRPLLASLLSEIVEHRELRITTAAGTGRIIFKNGYYIFQPDRIKDTSIPIAMRLVQVPVPRDRFVPKAGTAAAPEGAAAAAPTGPIVADAEEDSEALWNEVLEWVGELRAGTAAATVPSQILAETEKLREFSGLMKTQRERLEMIIWIYESVQADEVARGRLADLALEYIWDEFITTGTKRELLSVSAADSIVRAVAKDNYWVFEGVTYIRLLNAETNTIEYICADGAAKAPCPRAIIEVLERETAADPLLQKPIDVRYTGMEYGFLNFNPKKKKVVFKTGQPPMPKGKLGRGSECSINSGTTYEVELLMKLGGLLRAAGQSDLGLNDARMGKKRIQNAVRVCSVKDLVLRYMDKSRIQGKRWFYRELESKLFGHPLR